MALLKNSLAAVKLAENSFLAPGQESAKCLSRLGVREYLLVYPLPFQGYVPCPCQPRLKTLVCRQQTSLRRFPDRLITLRIRNMMNTTRSNIRTRAQAQFARY